MDALSLIVPAFVAGLLTFLAPCTLPLVPGYLGFISGVSLSDINNPEASARMRRKVFLNGVMYVLGFTFIFVLLGSLFGLGGAALIQYRIILARIGGIFVIIFGLYMMHVLKFGWLEKLLGGEHRFNFTRNLRPGHPTSSFIFGATFAFGWTPCIGPILGTVLLLASTSGTLIQGAILLLIFSAGLAIPFLLIALAIGWASKHLQALNKYLEVISVVGGVFLVLIGVLLLTDQFAYFTGQVYKLFEIFGYDSLLDYL
jgi:cytochrome c-type biogenesis protein